jgi:hypothetical protein
MAEYIRTSKPYFSQSFIDPNARQSDFPVTKHTLFVDNRDRLALNEAQGGPATNTAPYAFTISLDSLGRGRYENISSCELKELVFPKIANETYVVVDIEEFRDTYDSLNTTDGANDPVFAIVYFDGVEGCTADCGMKTGDRKPSDDIVGGNIVFKPTLQTIRKLTCNFRKHGGSVVTMADVGNVENVSFVLEIKTVNKNVGRVSIL